MLHCTCIQALCIVCSNYSLLGISDGGETEGDPVCSTEEESSQEFTASLKQFRTVNPHLHYTFYTKFYMVHCKSP